MTDELPFEPEIIAAARAIQKAVATGKNDAFQHAWLIADAIENMLERYFPDLPTANALEPRDTVDSLLEFYAAIHEDTGNEPPENTPVPSGP